MAKITKIQELPWASPVEISEYMYMQGGRNTPSLYAQGGGGGISSTLGEAVVKEEKFSKVWRGRGVTTSLHVSAPVRCYSVHVRSCVLRAS